MLHPQLFAQEVSDFRIVAIVTVSGIVGGAVKWAVDAYLGYRKTRSDEAEKKEERISDHFRVALGRAEAECKECRAENHELREKAEQLTNRNAIQGAHIHYLETLLTQWGKKFKPFRPGSSDDDPPPAADLARRTTPPEGYQSGS